MVEMNNHLQALHAPVLEGAGGREKKIQYLFAMAIVEE